MHLTSKLITAVSNLTSQYLYIKPLARYTRSGLGVVAALMSLASIEGIAHADSTVCRDLVYQASHPPSSLVLMASVVGGSVSTRTSGPGSSASFFMNNEQATSTPAAIGTPTAANRSEAWGSYLSGPDRIGIAVALEFPGRPGLTIDRGSITLEASGGVRVTSTTWNFSVLLDQVDCVRLETVPASGRAPALPVVLVTGRKTWAGYGTDSYQFVVRPKFETIPF